MKSEWRRFAQAQQIAWKATTCALPEEARYDGTYDHRPTTYPFCLPASLAHHNLLDEIREMALTRFERFDIHWHGETQGPDRSTPSTHLLDSQVQCVNCLLSLERAPEILLERLQRIVPAAQSLVPIRHADVTEGLVAFEWIGQENYLGERFRYKRRRGEYVTSADALMVVECSDGSRTGFLIEWKFTESYNEPVPFVSDHGTDRRQIYRGAYENESTAFIAKRPSIDVYFHDPHYQLLRQTLLAEKMLDAREHGVSRFVVLFLAPAANRELMAGVPDSLRPFGRTIDDVWRTLIRAPHIRFVWQDNGPWLTATPALAERYGALFHEKG